MRFPHFLGLLLNPVDFSRPRPAAPEPRAPALSTLFATLFDEPSLVRF